jgi:hypothetical protein
MNEQNPCWFGRASGRIRRISGGILDRRAVGNTISATILTGAVLAMSLAVLSWSEGRSSDFSREFGETVDSRADRLKEKLLFEYVFYSIPSNNMTIYLLNCGMVDDVRIKSVYVIQAGLLLQHPVPILNSLNGIPIPDQDLDITEGGYFTISLFSSLSSGFYSVRVVTERGSIFNPNFVA